MKLTARGLREAMHDDVGPRLFAVAAQLAGLKAELSGKSKRRAQAILGELEALRREVRRLSEGRGAEGPANLADALGALAKEVKAGFENQLRRAITKPGTVDCLYRIAREAARNAARHGKARKIVIRLAEGVLSVEDDGAGPAGGGRAGLGMRLMRARARQLGGRLSLQRVAGGTTVLTCHFPWPPE